MRTARDYRKADAKENMMLVHLVVVFAALAFFSLVLFWSLDLIK